MCHNFVRKSIVLRVFAAGFVLLMAFTCSSCGDSVSSDSTMTESLLNSYMKSFCDYNIGGMNRCCMANLDTFEDSDAIMKSCRSIAQRVEWENLNVSIDGNSAIAQVRIILPADLEGLCRLALNDTVKALDGGSDADFSASLASAIKKRAGQAPTQEMSVEIHMTKVDNKWYIVKSLGVNRMISEIRTSVVAVFSIIGG